MIDYAKKNAALPFHIVVTQADGKMKEIDAGKALRDAKKVAPKPDDAKVKADPKLVQAAAGKAATGLIDPADNHGGLKSFQYIAPFWSCCCWCSACFISRIALPAGTRSCS